MKSDMKLELNPNLPLREVVFLCLRSAILHGDLVPGERLMEVKLAQQLGVSRTPVRDAIQRLVEEGLVNMVPRCGAIVAGITDKDMRDVLEVRITLEELAVALCAERITDHGIKQLRSANKDFKKTVDDGDLLKIAEADVAFHDIIYSITDNKRLLQIINELREQIYRYRLEYIKNDRTRSQLVDEHEGIIKYISKGDTLRAKQAIRGHIENQMNAIENYISCNRTDGVEEIVHDQGNTGPL